MVAGSNAHKPWIVLVHGLGVDHRMWLLQLDSMQALGLVWSPDLPGFGNEPPFDSSSRTPERYADWLAEKMAAHCQGGVHVIGYSMGGSLAMLLALRHPKQVGSLTVCCSSPCWGRGWRRAVADVSASLAGPISMELFQQTILWGFSRWNRDPDVEAIVVDMVRKAHRPTMIDLFRSLARLDLRSRLGELRVPTLVVGATLDLLAPPSHFRLLADLVPEAELRVVRGATHLLCLSRADEFSSIVADFLSRHPLGNGESEAP